MDHRVILDLPHMKRNISSRVLAVLVACGGAATLAVASLWAADEPAKKEVVNFSQLLPLLPEAPAGWTADKPEGSTVDAGGFKMTNVHRDYHKGDAGDAPTVAISIIDAAANQEYIGMTTAAWNFSSESTEGYSKSINVDAQPGFETFENEGKHGTLWLLIAKRFFLEIETHHQDAKELQEWLRRIDLKKLATVK
jgi:hypothetical protein